MTTRAPAGQRPVPARDGPGRRCVIAAGLVLPAMVHRWGRGPVLRLGSLVLIVGVLLYTSGLPLPVTLAGALVCSLGGSLRWSRSTRSWSSTRGRPHRPRLSEGNGIAALAGLLGPLTVGGGARAGTGLAVRAVGDGGAAARGRAVARTQPRCLRRQSPATRRTSRGTTPGGRLPRPLPVDLAAAAVHRGGVLPVPLERGPAAGPRGDRGCRGRGEPGQRRRGDGHRPLRWCLDRRAGRPRASARGLPGRRGPRLRPDLGDRFRRSPCWPASSSPASGSACSGRWGSPARCAPPAVGRTGPRRWRRWPWVSPAGRPRSSSPRWPTRSASRWPSWWYRPCSRSGWRWCWPGRCHLSPP